MLSHDYSKLVLVVKYMNHKESNQDVKEHRVIMICAFCHYACGHMLNAHDKRAFQGNFVSSFAS